MAKPTKTPAGRRDFLRLMGVTAAVSGFGPAFGQSAKIAQPKDPQGVLNLAATAEALSVTFYHHTLSQATFRMDADTAAHLRQVLAAEQEHLELLAELGGQPLTREFALPDTAHTDAATFAATGLHLEETLLSAYIAAAHQFAEMGRPELAATAAQLAASEAQHQTLLSSAAGYGPGDVSLAGVPFRQVGDSSAVLAPFIGRVASGRVAVSLPNAASVTALAGQATRHLAFAHAHKPKG